MIMYTSTGGFGRGHAKRLLRGKHYGVGEKEISQKGGGGGEESNERGKEGPLWLK